MLHFVNNFYLFVKVLVLMFKRQSFSYGHWAGRRNSRERRCQGLPGTRGKSCWWLGEFHRPEIHLFSHELSKCVRKLFLRNFEKSWKSNFEDLLFGWSALSFRPGVKSINLFSLSITLVFVKGIPGLVCKFKPCHRQASVNMTTWAHCV